MDTLISLDLELQERLAQEAARRGQDAETFTRDLLRNALDNLPPARVSNQPRTAGLLTGQGWISDDSDAPLPDSFWPDREQKTAELIEREKIAAAQEWARWEAAGLRATASARATLRANGASRIYKRDGIIWEERPDGTTHPFDMKAAEEILSR